MFVSTSVCKATQQSDWQQQTTLNTLTWVKVILYGKLVSLVIFTSLIYMMDLNKTIKLAHGSLKRSRR